MKYKFLQLLIINIFFFHSSCDLSKPVKVETEKSGYMPTFSFDIIDIPKRMKVSTDSMAQLAVKMIEFMNNLKDQVELLSIPIDSLDFGPPWRYVWMDSSGVENLIILTYNKNENEYYWKFTKNGIDSISGFSNTNRTCLIGKLQITEYYLREELQIYNEVLEQVDIYAYFRLGMGIQIDYSIRHNNIELPVYYNLMYNKELIQINDYICNGLLSFYDSLNHRIYWNNDGSGHWQILNDSNSIIDSGSWY